MPQTNFKTLILLIVLLSSACSKKNDVVVNGTKYSDAKGTYVTVSKADWYLTTQGNGGTTNLKVLGATNADKLTITTAGDGLNSDININLENNGKFVEDIPISFSATSRATTVFRESTTLKAYRGKATFVVTLNSGDLLY